MLIMASIKVVNSSILRKFCTSSATNQLVKTPVQVFGIDGRYATALYSAAVKQKQLDAVEKELDKLKTVYSTDKVFREFILNPSIPKNLKESAIKGAASKLSLSSSSTNLLGLLAENGRLKHLPNIVNLFKTLMAAHRGDLNIEVIVAKQLDRDVQQELEATLRKFAKKGENISIAYKLDPSILGGLIVSIGDRYVDMSTASKVKKYSDILKSSA